MCKRSLSLTTVGDWKCQFLQQWRVLYNNTNSTLTGSYRASKHCSKLPDIPSDLAENKISFTLGTDTNQMAAANMSGFSSVSLPERQGSIKVLTEKQNKLYKRVLYNTHRGRLKTCNDVVSKGRRYLRQS